MRQMHDQQYSKFTPMERTHLTLAALSRGDMSEADRLWEICPRYKYEMYDIEYTQRVNALLMLGAMFFEKCVWHYNLIKKADTFIMCSEQELEHEERENFEDLASQTRRLIELATTAQNVHVSQIKGLFEGFKQFCADSSIDGEAVLKTLPIKECCCDLNLLLVSDAESSTQYTMQMKNFFCEQWSF